MKTIKLNIQSYNDRRDMVFILAQNGFKTWVEEVKESLTTSYYVYFEVEDNAIKPDKR